MSYKITITNNEDGKVLVNEENAVAIVGAITNKGKTRSIGFTDCDSFKLANAVSRAEYAISEIKKQSPEVALLLCLKKLSEEK